MVGHLPHTKQAPKLWKIIWKIDCPVKVMHFLWRCCSNLIPVAQQLRKKKLNSDGLCCFYRMEESVENALVTCDWCICVWFGILGLRVD